MHTSCDRSRLERYTTARPNHLTFLSTLNLEALVLSADVEPHLGMLRTSQ